MENLLLVQKKNNQQKKILEEILLEKNQKKLLDLYIEILEINNTAQDIIFKYLLFVKEIYGDSINCNNTIEEFKNYINHIPIKKWNDNFSDIVKKEYSSLEKLDSIFQKILSQNWIHTDYKNIKLILQYFNNCIMETKKEINNTSPITWENEELYIYYLFREFIGKIKEKILYYSQEKYFKNIKNEEFIKCNKNIKKLESELKDNISETLKNKLLELIENEKKIRTSIILSEGDFFKKYLYHFYKFLLTIKNTFLKDFSKKKLNKKEDKEFFERFMFYISNYDFENLTREMLDVWEKSFTNLDFSEKMKIVGNFIKKYSPFHIKFEDEMKIEITLIEYTEPIIVGNIDDYYDLEKLLEEIRAKETFDENEFIKYVKIPKRNEHLYIKKIMEEWIRFNITIFNSNTIKSLYGSLFKEQDNSLLKENELKTVLENIVYYTFEADFKGLTIRPTMKIYEYGPLIPLQNKDVSKLISLAFLLDINHHEILGHYNIGYQIFSNQEKDKKYDSPIISNELSSDYAKNRDNKESGENIEIKLYSKVIDSLTLKEALFILNPKNYQVDYEKFKEKFKECNKEKINIDQEFSDILQKFNIDSKNIPDDENNKYSIATFIKKFTGYNSYTIKGKHHIGYNIDGVKNENLDFINEIILNLDILDIK